MNRKKTVFALCSVLFITFLIGIFMLVTPTSCLIAKDKKVRPYLSTGPWYPSNSDELKKMVENFFNHAKTTSVDGKIVGLIGPHAGLVYSGQCAANAYKALINRPKFERVIILGVSHRGDFYGAAVGDFDFDRTPLGDIQEDTEITAKLAKEKYFTRNNAIMQNEHSIETHLPFLQFVQSKQDNSSLKIVPILFGYVNPKDFKPVAAIIKKYVSPNTLLIASTDFTHYGESYGYAPFNEGPKENIKDQLTGLDMGMVNILKVFDLNRYVDYKKKAGITMCGFIPVGILMTVLDMDKGSNAQENPYVLIPTDYYKSGDQGNDYTLSVSYVSAVITKKTPDEQGAIAKKEIKIMSEASTEKHNDDNSGTMKLSIQEKKTLLALARQTLENHFEGKQPGYEELDNLYHFTPLLKEKAGVFVTLRKHGDLRGCIGNIVGICALWEGVRDNALNAAFSDPRFPKLTKDELKKIDIEISVMTPLQEIHDYKKIRMGIDGVIIRKGYYQAVFLPQVATETGWDVDQFLYHLCRKAGLSGNEYKSNDMEFRIFQALVFEEKEMK